MNMILACPMWHNSASANYKTLLFLLGDNKVMLCSVHAIDKCQSVLNIFLGGGNKAIFKFTDDCCLVVWQAQTFRVLIQLTGSD